MHYRRFERFQLMECNANIRDHEFRLRNDFLFLFSWTLISGGRGRGSGDRSRFRG